MPRTPGLPHAQGATLMIHEEAMGAGIVGQPRPRIGEVAGGSWLALSRRQKDDKSRQRAGEIYRANKANAKNAGHSP